MAPSYAPVRAVVWECGERQSQRHTDGRGQYTFRLGYASRETTTGVWLRTENAALATTHQAHSLAMTRLSFVVCREERLTVTKSVQSQIRRHLFVFCRRTFLHDGLSYLRSVVGSMMW